MKMLQNFGFKVSLGVLARLMVLSPFVVGLFYTGKYANYVDNLNTFMLVVLGVASVLYLVVMMLIPPEYAIKTEISVLEFNMWRPQVVAVNVMGVVTLGVCIALASAAMYVSATIIFLYGISMLLWPRYARRIDAASKDHMMQQLANNN